MKDRIEKEEADKKEELIKEYYRKAVDLIFDGVKKKEAKNV
jgi:hypothetical protein